MKTTSVIMRFRGTSRWPRHRPTEMQERGSSERRATRRGNQNVPVPALTELESPTHRPEHSAICGAGTGVILRFCAHTSYKVAACNNAALGNSNCVRGCE